MSLALGKNGTRSINDELALKATAAQGALAATAVQQTDTPTALTIEATTGTLPTADGSLTIADASTPTVAELLEAVVELNAKIEALRTALAVV